MLCLFFPDMTPHFLSWSELVSFGLHKCCGIASHWWMNITNKKKYLTENLIMLDGKLMLSKCYLLICLNRFPFAYSHRTTNTKITKNTLFFLYHQIVSGSFPYHCPLTDLIFLLLPSCSGFSSSSLHFFLSFLSLFYTYFLWLQFNVAFKNKLILEHISSAISLCYFSVVGMLLYSNKLFSQIFASTTIFYLMIYLKWKVVMISIQVTS